MLGPTKFVSVTTHFLNWVFSVKWKCFSYADCFSCNQYKTTISYFQLFETLKTIISRYDQSIFWAIKYIELYSLVFLLKCQIVFSTKFWTRLTRHLHYASYGKFRSKCATQIRTEWLWRFVTISHLNKINSCHLLSCHWLWLPLS